LPLEEIVKSTSERRELKSPIFRHFIHILNIMIRAFFNTVCEPGQGIYPPKFQAALVTPKGVSEEIKLVVGSVAMVALWETYSRTPLGRH
jgi:hypothetical protein